MSHSGVPSVSGFEDGTSLLFHFHLENDLDISEYIGFARLDLDPESRSFAWASLATNEPASPELLDAINLVCLGQAEQIGLITSGFTFAYTARLERPFAEDITQRVFC